MEVQNHILNLPTMYVHWLLYTVLEYLRANWMPYETSLPIHLYQQLQGYIISKEAQWPHPIK